MLVLACLRDFHSPDFCVNITSTFTYLFNLTPNPIPAPTHKLNLIFLQIFKFCSLSLRIAWVEYSDSSSIPCIFGGILMVYSKYIFGYFLRNLLKYIWIYIYIYIMDFWYFLVLQVTTVYFRLQQDYTGLYRLIQAYTGPYRLLQVTTGYFRGLMITSGYYRLLNKVTG